MKKKCLVPHIWWLNNGISVKKSTQIVWHCLVWLEYVCTALYMFDPSMYVEHAKRFVDVNNTNNILHSFTYTHCSILESMRKQMKKKDPTFTNTYNYALERMNIGHTCVVTSSFLIFLSIFFFFSLCAFALCSICLTWQKKKKNTVLYYT